MRDISHKVFVIIKNRCLLLRETAVFFVICLKPSADNDEHIHIICYHCPNDGQTDLESLIT